MKTTEKQKQRIKEYDSRPENKLKKKKYMKLYLPAYELKNKERISKRKKEYYIKHKEYIDNRNKEYNKRNKDKINKYLQTYNKINRDKLLNYRREWENNNRTKRREQHNQRDKIRRKEDLNYIIKRRVRLRIWQYFKGLRKQSSDELGINYKEIINRLIKILPKDFYEKNYVIDHIKPLCSFDLTKPEEVRKAFAPENHQWLTREDNGFKIKEDLKNRNLYKF